MFLTQIMNGVKTTEEALQVVGQLALPERDVS